MLETKKWIERRVKGKLNRMLFQCKSSITISGGTRAHAIFAVRVTQKRNYEDHGIFWFFSTFYFQLF